MSNYQRLVHYVTGNASDPLTLAETLNAWIYESVGASGPEPTNVEDVANLLTGFCGWRANLMSALFDVIGIESRWVGFFNVPFVGSHAGVELYIDNQWMFFDPTFGVYFTDANGDGPPLSLAEARADWRDVVVNKCTLDGWSGTFGDLNAIDPATDYAPYTDNLVYFPGAYEGRDGLVDGEIDHLYFTALAYTGQEGLPDTWAYVPVGADSWVVHTDATAPGNPQGASWSAFTDTYDGSGHLDTRFGTFDDGRMWSVDWDQANQFAWDRQFTLITASALVDFTVTVNDDGTVVVNDLDQTQANDWASKVIVYSASGDMQSETVTYDDGHIAILHPGDPGFADAAQADPLGFYTSAFPDYDNPTLTSDAGISYFVDDDTGRLVTMGGPGDDVINGTPAKDTIYGGGGSDTLIGGPGDDTFVVDNADDTVIENRHEGQDTIYTSVDYALPDNVENLVLVGSAVTGKGNSGDNYIYGDALHNVLLGGGGTDAMLGGAGDDIYVVTSANDAVIENADQGHDTVLSAATAYTLPDNVETLMLVGNAYDGTGNELNNLVVGNANNNVLDGGPAADILIGGRGRDNFVFHDGEANHDVVVDFKGNGSLTDDHLTFTGYGTADDGASLVQLDAVHWQVNSADGSTQDVITLLHGAHVQANDFTFV